MLVNINPADVVSIPADYKNTKGRCWRYEVVDEIPFGAKDKVDASSPACVNTEDVTKDYVPSEVEKRVVLILAEQMAHDPKTIHLGTTVDQLGADSLDALEIQMATEDSFEIEFAEGDMERMRTVGELVRFIESKSAQTQGDDTPMTNLGREDDRFAKFLLAEVIRGEDLKNLREELNISGTVLATELGVSRSSVWSFENSNHPKRETVERAVTALKAIASRS
jgi:acyl carrier protein